jgi:hypothetical protein
MYPAICALLTIMTLLFVAPVHAQEQDAQRIATYAQCQKLASPKTDAAEKTQLTQLFKNNTLYCAMLTAPFQTQNIFSAGQNKTQLRLVMSPSNHYVIDGKSLLDALIPDRASIPPAQFLMLAGQIIGVLGDMFSSNVDPASLKHISGKVGALSSMMGVNARSAQQQLDALYTQTRLAPTDIEPSFWLTKMARIAPPAPSAQMQAQQGAPPIGPAWMQKALGAAKNLIGTFQMSGE